MDLAAPHRYCRFTVWHGSREGRLDPKARHREFAVPQFQHLPAVGSLTKPSLNQGIALRPRQIRTPLNRDDVSCRLIVIQR